MDIEKSCVEFAERLASASPVPGGGGTAALVGALGVALSSMVANLTLGKKKYEQFQERVKATLESAELLRIELLALVAKDAEVFEPLSKAYGMPRETEEEMRLRNEVMERSLVLAAEVPLDIVKKVASAIPLFDTLLECGSRLAISDVGVGILLCRSAMQSAALNVYINTKLMKDTKRALALSSEASAIVDSGIADCDRIYQNVLEDLIGAKG